jgi:hypothetical protein
MAYPLSRYLSVQQAYAPGFLEGERIAFLSTMTGLPQLYSVTLSTDGEPRWPDPLTFESDRAASRKALRVSILDVLPKPTPTINRPWERRSRVARLLARFTGLRSALSRTDVPSSTRLVSAAA